MQNRNDATTIERTRLRSDSPLCLTDSWLEGEQAALLYAAEIVCRMGALDEQLGLLQAALDERQQLLREIGSRYFVLLRSSDRPGLSGFVDRCQYPHVQAIWWRMRARDSLHRDSFLLLHLQMNCTNSMLKLFINFC